MGTMWLSSGSPKQGAEIVTVQVPELWGRWDDLQQVHMQL